MGVNQVDASSFEEIVLKNERPVLVDFYASWCRPCQIISPLVEELAKEYEGKLEAVKVDIDQASDVASQYNILSIPTIIIFEKGREKERIVGVVSKDVLVDSIKKVV
jgi:thioredoxin 1